MPRAPSKLQKTAKKTALVPQPNGKGALLPGGEIGNKGGTGQPPAALRGSMCEILAKGLPHFEEFATGERTATLECPECGETVPVKATRPADQLKAIEIACRFGLPKESYDKDLVDELWDATTSALLDHPELAEDVKTAWMPVLAQRLMAGG